MNLAKRDALAGPRHKRSGKTSRVLACPSNAALPCLGGAIPGLKSRQNLRVLPPRCDTAEGVNAAGRPGLSACCGLWLPVRAETVDKSHDEADAGAAGARVTLFILTRLQLFS